MQKEPIVPSSRTTIEQAEVSSPLVLLAEYVTLAGEFVTLALLDLSAECVTLAGVATRSSSGISKVIIT